MDREHEKEDSLTAGILAIPGQIGLTKAI
ncbi:uncharacterized protein G2W53_003173 [Senna tora]|uniref:Uncharacterized protein n=1 Tax=Senna tora TaxID=362788 RepID=A0A834XA28_9FABA|nr:uncharacterized protein G2W53_003173 [Senna tora]